MTKQLNLQDMFLNTLRKERTEVTVFLTNGYQIKGCVKGYDSFVLMMDSDGKQQMIYHCAGTSSHFYQSGKGGAGVIP